MSVALVVPVLNEAAQLPALLDSTARQTTPFTEIAICDGGSSDDTIAVAQRFGVRVLLGSRGRGEQIAAGIEATSAPIVLVLHADARCDSSTVQTIVDHWRRNPQSPGGCLGHRFDGGSWPLRLVEWADRRRARRGVSYGDQGQFFRRDALDRIGGFPRLPIMEDLEFCRRLRRLGTLAYLDCPIVSSPRGFEKYGVVRTVLRNARLRRAYLRRGVAAEDLYRRYYDRANPPIRSATS